MSYSVEVTITKGLAKKLADMTRHMCRTTWAPRGKDSPLADEDMVGPEERDDWIGWSTAKLVLEVEPGELHKTTEWAVRKTLEDPSAPLWDTDGPRTDGFTIPVEDKTWALVEHVASLRSMPNSWVMATVVEKVLSDYVGLQAEMAAEWAWPHLTDDVAGLILLDHIVGQVFTDSPPDPATGALVERLVRALKESERSSPGLVHALVTALLGQSR